VAGLLRDLFSEVETSSAHGLVGTALAGFRGTTCVGTPREHIGSPSPIRLLEDREDKTAMETIWQDITYGTRMLIKSPGFTAVAILTLALGIGANTAIFSIANAFMFRPMPVKDADRLAVVTVQNSIDSDPGQLSYLDFLDYRQQSEVFTDMTSYVLDLGGLSSEGRADRVILSYVTSNFFSMLGIRPTIGRLIQPDEGDQPKTGPVVVLGYSYWQKHFSGDPGVIGRTVDVSGQAVTVIGVVDKTFTGPYSIVEMDAYLPIGLRGFNAPGAATGESALFSSRGDRELRVLATLKPGVSVEQAQSALGVIAGRLSSTYPQEDKDQIVRVFMEHRARPEPGATDYMPLITTIFLVLVGLVLLVACVNVANLLLARASGRQREMAVRAALGAGRARLIRQMLTESLILAAGGGVAGALMGNWVCHLLEGVRPIGDFPIRFGFTFDWRVFTYVAVVCLFSGVVAGLVPALRVSRTNINDTLRESGRGLIGGGGRHRLRNALVVLQVAISLIVLVAAGLFARSLAKAESVDLGFNPHHILNVGLNPALQGYDRPRTEALMRQLLVSARAMPGVESASISYSFPMGYYSDGAGVYAEGQSVDPSSRVPGSNYDSVSSDYFTVMQMPIDTGRAFTDADTAQSLAVGIVNQTIARLRWPGEDPLGRRFSYQGPNGPWVTVVGVVRDAKLSSLTAPIGRYFFVPQSQAYKPEHILQLRTAGPPEATAAAIQGEVRALDPNLAVYDVLSMDQALANGGNGFFLFKVGAGFAGTLGGLGLLLAVVGVYGVVSYNASQRRHEIGIRMALGARQAGILRLVLGQAGALVGTGVGIGILAALAVTRFLSGFLVGVGAYDPATFATVAGLLIGAALVACYLPAYRAAQVDPATALRYE